MRSARGLALLVLLCALAPALLRAAPSPAELAQAAAKRFPQPVRVGDLLHRSVIQPTESQDLLGHVERVVRGPDGVALVVIGYGGVLGLGARPVAIPVDAMVLVGDVMEVVGLKPAELRALPTYGGAGANPVGPDEVIKVGLAKPSH